MKEGDCCRGITGSISSTAPVALGMSTCRLGNLFAFGISLPSPLSFDGISFMGTPVNNTPNLTLRSKRAHCTSFNVQRHRTIVTNAESSSSSIQGGGQIPFEKEPQLGDEVKRKRGRPKGSKNRSKGEKIKSSAKKTWTSEKRWSGGDSDENDFESVDDDDSEYTMRAPNGLNSGPRDFLQELLPMMAQQEMRELQDESEDDKALRGLLSDAMTEMMQRGSESRRLDNLRPFKNRAKPVACDACNSTGMVTCSYCKGEGMVDFGEDAHKFYKEFRGTRMQLTKKVMGNVYLCPYCGGLMEERCEKCLGLGDLVDEDQEREPYAAREDYRTNVWSQLNIEKILSEREGEIEYGKDGIIVVRAKTRKGKGGRKPKKGQKEYDAEELGDASLEMEGVQEAPKKKRGRPRKQKAEADDGGQETSDGTMANDSKPVVTTRDSKVRAVKEQKQGPSTDFVNTTDYRVGRRLRRRKTILAESNSERSEWSSTYESDDDNNNGDDENDNGKK